MSITMHRISPLIPVLLAVLLWSCGSSEQTQKPAPEPAYRYGSTAEMTDEYVEAKDRSISVLLPVGWQLTRDDRNAPNILLWLVRDDYGASLSFTPLNMDPALYSAVRTDGLEALARVSLSLKQGSAEDSVRVVQAVESFTLSGRRFAAYEYRVGSAPGVIRVVVFDTGGGVFECALLPASETVDPQQNRELFETQQSVLLSLLLP